VLAITLAFALFLLLCYTQRQRLINHELSLQLVVAKHEIQALTDGVLDRAGIKVVSLPSENKDVNELPAPVETKPAEVAPKKAPEVPPIFKLVVLGNSCKDCRHGAAAQFNDGSDKWVRMTCRRAESVEKPGRYYYCGYVRSTLPDKTNCPQFVKR
jgi:hypothetical protein